MKRTLLVILSLACLFTSNARAVLVFWDQNGISEGAGGPSPTGTWNADAFAWNTNADGLGAQGPQKWGDGDYAVFAAGNDATGAYTVYVSNLVTVADIHVDLGTVTFSPDPTAGGALNLVAFVKVHPDDVYPSLVGNTNRLLSVGHKDPNATAIYNVVLTNANGIIRYKRGTLVFGVTNKFTGPVQIEGGRIKLGVPNAVPTDCPLVLENNDTSRQDFDPAWQYEPAVFDTGGFSQQLGTLGMAGTDVSVQRVLDLGHGTGTLAFADSSGEDWGSFTLTINGYNLHTSKLRFGTTTSGLTAAQLSQMQFADFANLPGVIDSSGYVAPALPKLTATLALGVPVQLVWNAVNGRTYRVWSHDKLNAGSWDNRADVMATADTASYTDPVPSLSGRFYRVEVLP
jgi:hypothetical protein